ncbi:hypothetical protein TEA_030062 [Camellia sinensis var. sinensis]|uniref:GST C-terminal domain-containing protein n=1 Tax=Camellia sinensis var. sinensis TaxID=542762 RepID=A0A4S4DCK7_CAMSN|nr:hypothetical protein TEA_030062 [Camellia sinensis var. sinensis]
MFSTGEAQETAKNDLIGYLKVLEGELEDKAYFGGEIFGIVDVALVPSYSFFFAYEQSGNFSIVAECPALVAWVHWCMEKESVSKHLPDQHKVYDSMLERKKKLQAKSKENREERSSIDCDLPNVVEFSSSVAREENRREESMKARSVLGQQKRVYIMAILSKENREERSSIACDLPHVVEFSSSVAREKNRREESMKARSVLGQQKRVYIMAIL